MGKGKGVVDDKNGWVYRLQTGKILFEVGFMSKSRAYRILLSSAKKLPVPTIVISRHK
jgi:ribosomal protein L16/L10AE